MSGILTTFGRLRMARPGPLAGIPNIEWSVVVRGIVLGICAALVFGSETVRSTAITTLAFGLCLILDKFQPDGSFLSEIVK